MQMILLSSCGVKLKSTSKSAQIMFHSLLLVAFKDQDKDQGFMQQFNKRNVYKAVSYQKNRHTKTSY